MLPIISLLNPLWKETSVNQLLETNEKTKKTGLTLTREQVLQVVDARTNTLKHYERIELGIGVTQKIMELFSASPFVNEQNYMTTVIELQEIFYYFKNETGEKISDDDLIKAMNKYYDGECGGSLQFLKGKMETFAKDARLEELKKELLDEGKDIFERKG